nr:bifunctional DNA primase/polymerase [Mycobacterium sp. UM_NZ2]
MAIEARVEHSLVARAAELAGWVDAFQGHGMHLLALGRSTKVPAAGSAHWPDLPAPDRGKAIAWLESGGNLGLNLGKSALIGWDADNAAGAEALLAAGYQPATVSANAQNPSHSKGRFGGRHFLWRVPDQWRITGNELTGDRVRLTGGGVIDVLAGRHYMVLPPSVIAEEGFVGTYLDAGAWNHPIPELPKCFWPDEFRPADAHDCPPGLEPLRGAVRRRTAYERVEQSAQSDELSATIDSVSWDEWLTGETRLSYDPPAACGCERRRWINASNGGSVTLHDGCWVGGGNAAHVFSETMAGDLGLGNKKHLTRLQLSAKLRDVTEQAAAAAVGISLGGRQELTGIDPDDIDADARTAEAAGDAERAAALRSAARALRASSDAVAAAAPGEIGSRSRIAGGVPTPPQLRMVPGGGETESATARPQLAVAPPIGSIGVAGTAALKPTPPVPPAAEAAPAEEAARDEPFEPDLAPELLTDAQRQELALLVAGGLNPVDPELYPKGFPSSISRLRRIMDFSDLTRAIFHRARSRRSVHPVGLYMADLIRFAKTLPTDLGPFPGVPLSTYATFIGIPGSGKSQTVNPCNSLWPTPMRTHRGGNPSMLPTVGLDPNLTHRLGSGQVLVDLFGYLVKTKKKKNESTEEIVGDQTDCEFRLYDPPVVHCHEDELSAFIIRSGGPTATIMQTLVSGWSRADIGDASRTAGTLKVLSSDDPYTTFFTGLVQPELAANYIATRRVGFIQRCWNLAVDDPYRMLGLPVLARPAVTPTPTLQLGAETVFELCESIRRAIRDGERLSSIATPVGHSDLDSHALMRRMRLACIIAAFHGTLTVSEEIWAHSGDIEEFHDVSQAHLEARSDAAAKRDAGKTAEVLAVGRKFADAAQRATVEACARRMLDSVIRAEQAGQDGKPLSEVRKVLNGKRRGEAPSERQVYADDAIRVLLETPGVRLEGARVRCG